MVKYFFGKVMKKSKQLSQIPMKTCSLCNKSTEAEGTSLIYFGEWMTKKEITVHYYCLLLSTHLPQRGEDHGGILGFLLRDIRLEIAMAKNRKCKYCLEVGATIQCCICQRYFHLTCGHTSKCLSQFVGDFKSYCHDCIPTDRYQMELFARKPPQKNELCFICARIMGTYPKGWIYAKCCGNGFTHLKCMKIYALSAGYYLSCIWCKDAQFREDVKYLGVFVPDREANWEKEKGAYGELYRKHKRCDMEVCNCPKGRDYSNAFKWQLIICKLCGAYGAHNPSCIPGFEGSKEKLKEFKCDICSVTEQTVFSNTIVGPQQDFINTSLYVGKNKTRETESNISLSQNSNIFVSNDCNLSRETTNNGNCINSSVTNLQENMKFLTEMYNLTQSPVKSQQSSAPESFAKNNFQEYDSDSDDSIIANLMVQKVFDIFEVSKEKTTDTRSECKLNINATIANTLSSKNEPECTPTESLTESTRLSQEIAPQYSCLHEIGQQENSDSDDSTIADLLVKKFFEFI